MGQEGRVEAGKGDNMVPGALSNPRTNGKEEQGNYTSGDKEKKQQRQVAKRTSMRHRHESGKRQRET